MILQKRKKKTEKTVGMTTDKGKRERNRSRKEREPLIGRNIDAFLTFRWKKGPRGEKKGAKPITN